MKNRLYVAGLFFLVGAASVQPGPEDRVKQLAAANALKAAVRAGDLEAVKKTIAEGADPNDKAPRDDRTFLTIAAGHGHLEVVRYLVEQGADVNKKGLEYSPHLPIWSAIHSGSLPTVAFLVEKGVTQSKGSLLSAAILTEANHIAQYFIDLGADVNYVDNLSGETPLITAAALGQLDIVTSLILAGAKIDFKTKKGKTAIDVAKTDEIRRYLVNMMLSQAIQEKNFDTVKYAVEKGADVNPEYGTPLMAAAAAGDLRIVAYLLSKGANADARSRTNETALQQAVEHGHKPVVALLLANLEHEKGMEIVNKDGLLALATAKGHIDVVRYLLEQGADVFATDSDGRAAFSYAIHQNKEVYTLVKKYVLLKKHGTDAPGGAMPAELPGETSGTLERETEPETARTP